MADDVANLMIAAALHGIVFPEDLIDGLSQRLGTVDHEQTLAERAHAASDQFFQVSSFAQPTRKSGSPSPTGTTSPWTSATIWVAL